MLLLDTFAKQSNYRNEVSETNLFSLISTSLRLLTFLHVGTTFDYAHGPVMNDNLPLGSPRGNYGTSY